MKLILSLLLLFPCAKVYGEDLINEFVKEVIVETLKGRAPSPADPKIYGQIAYEVSMGKSGRIVDQFFESLKPESIKNDMQQSAMFFVFKQIAPVVGVYAETALSVYSMVETYVNDWQDWAMQNRLTEFNEDVLSKTTVKELDNAYIKFTVGTDDSIGVENRMAGILYHKRPEVMAKMKEAYEKRRKELEAQERRKALYTKMLWAKIDLEKQLDDIRAEAQKKAREITLMMKNAKIPLTKENFEKYLKDKDLYSKLKSDYDKEIESKLAKGEKISTGDEKADTVVNIAVTQKNNISNSSNFSIPDYSALLREYGLNADRLLTNNISSSEHINMKNLIYNSANSLNSACTSKAGASGDKSNYSLCSQAYSKFSDEASQIDKRLAEYGEKLKADLEALTMKDYPITVSYGSVQDDYYEKLKSEFFSLSQAKSLDRYNGIMYSIDTGNNYEEDYDHWVNWSWETKTDPEIKKMEKFRDSIASIAGAYETMVSAAAEKTKLYKAKMDELDRKYNESLSKYDELYSKNSSLAQYFGIKKYEFRLQADLLSMMLKRVSESCNEFSTNFLSESCTARWRVWSAKARGLQEKWNKEIELNNKFLAQFKPVLDEIREKSKIKNKNGSIEPTKENLDKMEAKINPVLNKAYCVTDAMEENRGGFPYKDRAVSGNCFMSIAEHKKQLSELSKLASEHGIEDFYSRRDFIYTKVEEMSKAKKELPINVPCKEVSDIENEANKISWLFSNFSKFSKENIGAAVSSYAKAIDRMQEIEDNMKSFACQSMSVEENKKAIASYPWIVSPDVEKYCLTPSMWKTSFENSVNEVDAEQIIKGLYEELKSAYESRNASKVVSLIDSGWQSPDGDDMSDLQQHLSRIFGMFNEITFKISDFRIIKESSDSYAVSYNLEMTSRIYSKNIRRVESSSVSEKVKIEKGKAKIYKTENGSYWLIK